nr:unnamed protein product [Callosobruchus chinensis]
MRKLGVLQKPSQSVSSGIQPQFHYGDYQIPLNNLPFSYPPIPARPYYQLIPYIPGQPAPPYSYGTPYSVPQSNIIPQMVYVPGNNATTQNVQDRHIPSFPYPQAPAQTYTPSVGQMQPEFTYIPTYQYKNQPIPPMTKKRRHRHKYVIKKDSSQNYGNQSESRVIDKHEVQSKTYSFRKTFVVTPEKRPSGPITINLLNGVPVTTPLPEEITMTSIPTTTTEDNEIPEDTTGFVNVFKWK